MDYTLRVLMYCADSQTRTQPITISEIADSYLWGMGIPHGQFQKFIGRLKKP